MRAERRERGGLLQHPLGEIGLHAHPFPLAGAERPGLVPDRVRHAQPAEARGRGRRAAACATSSVVEPELRARPRRPARRPRGRGRACTVT